MMKNFFKKTKAVDVIKTCKSLVYLNRLKNKKTVEKIKVVFLFQMPEIWNKLELVFQEMVEDNNFEVIVLAIPKQNIDAIDEENDYGINDAFEYSKNFKCKVINARENNCWINLEELNGDYVFYQRPYDNYLPKEYRSKEVIKHAKTCYISYGFEFTQLNEDVILDRNFFRNIYMFFAETEEIKNIVEKRDILAYKLDKLKILNLGYPCFEKMIKGKNELEDNWERTREKDSLRIMWTPRWTTDVNLFPTNFFEYKEKLLEKMERKKNRYLLIRMHPLAFENFIKTNNITKIELEILENRIDNMENVSFDRNKGYIDSFWNSDVLISDMSSVVIEYFLTGKPIIYCDKYINRLNEFGKKISEGFYIVSNFEEIDSILEEIENGNDRLKEKREKIIKELFGKNNINASNNIKKSIYIDGKKNVN